MKVFKDGKEVKGAEVIFDNFGNAEVVRIDGVNYTPSAFEIKVGKATKQIKPAEKATKQGATSKLRKVFKRKDAKNANSEVLSTEDLQ